MRLRVLVGWGHQQSCHCQTVRSGFLHASMVCSCSEGHGHKLSSWWWRSCALYCVWWCSALLLGHRDLPLFPEGRRRRMEMTNGVVSDWKWRSLHLVLGVSTFLIRPLDRISVPFTKWSLDLNYL